MNASAKSPAIPDASDPRQAYLDAPGGWRSWLLPTDHKRVALLFLGTLATAFVIAMLYGLIAQFGLTGPGKAGPGPIVTMHGVLMVFLFVVPAVPATLGNFLVPLMVGARGLAFPRLSQASLVLYWTAICVALGASIAGSATTGWTLFAASAAGDEAGRVGVLGLAAALSAISVLLTSLNLVVTIHKQRAAGLEWKRLPIFVWASYVAAAVQAVATPIVLMALVLFVADAPLGLGLFDARLGGDPLLREHFFWAGAHPLVYATFLPVVGILTEVIAVQARRRPVGAHMLVAAVIVFALVSFVTWGQHLVVAGQSEFASTVFSLLSFVGAVPVALMLANWVATLRGGSIAFNAPLAWALAAVVNVVVGVGSGLFLAMLGLNVHLHGTHFVVGHLHYLLLGGVTTALVAGLYHWWPKITGRRYDEGTALLGALGAFLGVNLTFFARFVLGARGLPRWDAISAGQAPVWVAVSHLGAVVLVVSIGAVIVNLVRSFTEGELVVSPERGASLEWETTTPPPTDNFEHAPRGDADPYDYARRPDERPHAGA